MRKLLALAFCLPMMACVVGSDGTTPPGGDDDTNPPPPPPGDGLSGSITADQTLTGTVSVTGDLVIEAGVTVTISAGTVVTVADNRRIDVKGTLDAQGTSAAHVTLASADGKYFGGVNVGDGGTLTAAYLDQRGGKITTQTGASVTATDSKFGDTGGDFFIMNGGTLTITQSQIGADPGLTDATHCNFHLGGIGNIISVTKSNIIGTPFALMFYSGANAVFTDNNWDKNALGATDWIDSQPGVSGDFSRSFFSAGPPVAKAGAQFTLDNLAAARIPDAGPRP